MPPRGTYKIYPILVKTHKLTLFLESSPTQSVSELKEEIISAYSSSLVNAGGAPTDIPYEVTSVADFELCRELQERQGRFMVPTGKFEALDEDTPVMKQTIPYETLFIRFKIDGKRVNPEYTPAPISADDDEDDPGPEMPSGKGKEKM